MTSAWRCVWLSNPSYTEQGRGLFLSASPWFHQTQQLCMSRQSGAGQLGPPPDAQREECR